MQQGQDLLLVCNRRRNGSTDWSTPGGVVDEGETVLTGLTREVLEETGIAVQQWSTKSYGIQVDFADNDMTLEVHAHTALEWSGELIVDDPDGIVIDAGFHGPQVVREHLAASPVWVREPLLHWLADNTLTSFGYRVTGSFANPNIERL